MKIFTCALALGLSALSAAAFADIRDQMDIRTGKAELVIPDPNPQKIANDVKEALNEWSIPAKMNFRTLPSTIPARPDEPEAAQVIVQGTPAIEYRCKTAYAEIVKSPPPVNNAFMYMKEFTQACVYPFQKGVKVYLIFTSAKKTESLTSGLFTGIAKAIRGDDAEFMTKQLNKSIADIKKAIPSVLVARLEVPGQAIQEPDKDAVAALIPAKMESPLPVPQVVMVQPANAPIAQPTASTPMATKIEARKSLTGMGITYHAYDQFIASIKRKDDVAVQLFLDAGAIDLSIKDKNGKTALDIAKETGISAIISIIEAHLSGQTASAVSATSATPQAAPVAPATPAPAASAVVQPDKRKMAMEAARQLPAEIVAGIDEQINAMNLAPEQRQAMRDQALINMSTQLAAIKGFTDRIDPETGRLKP